MLALAASGSAHEGDWLIAERQTAGRGRQGRAWASPSGNLYASGLVELCAGDPPAPTLALTTGIAVIEALDTADLMLKWPNDILAGTAKLAGILLERQNDHIVVGIGINLVHAPDLPDRPTTTLSAIGTALAVDAAANALVAAFGHWLHIWRTDGLPVIRAGWLARAHPIGTPLAAGLSDGARIEGLFDGLTPDCALQLRLADGTARVIHAGDVFLI